MSAHDNVHLLPLKALRPRPESLLDMTSVIILKRHVVFPIVTGTFGGVDFFHSVMGELSDKTTQSEIQELEGSVAQSQRAANKSMVQELLSSLPTGFLGEDKSGKADELEANATAQQMKNTRISPRQPEAWTEYLNQTIEGMRPILEFHDDIVRQRVAIPIRVDADSK